MGRGIALLLVVGAAIASAQLQTIQGSDTISSSRAAINNNFTWLRDNRAALSHVHLIADITGLQDALDGKAATSHNHASVYQAISSILTEFSGLECEDGEIPKKASGVWSCAADDAGEEGGGSSAEGTDSATWQIDADNDGPKLKNSSGKLQLRNADDDAFADLVVRTIEVIGDGNPTQYTTETAPAGTPSSGKAYDWVDLTSKVRRVKDADGNISSTVRGIADPEDTQVVLYVDQAGVQHRGVPQAAGCSYASNGGEQFVPGFAYGIGAYPNWNSAAPGTGTNNAISMHHLYIPCSWTANSISIRVDAAALANCSMMIGIYNDDRSSLVMSTGTMTQSTTVDCDTTGVKTLTAATNPAATGLGVEHPAGWYWIAATGVESSTAGTYKILAGTFQSPEASLFNAVTDQVGYLPTGGGACSPAADGVLPASLSGCAMLTTAVPLVMILLAY